MSEERLLSRLQMLAAIEDRFIQEDEASYQKIIEKLSVSRSSSCQAASLRHSKFQKSQHLCRRDTERQILDGGV